MIISLAGQKFSCVAIQPTEADGKYPNLLFGPNLEETISTNSAVNKYFPP